MSGDKEQSGDVLMEMANFLQHLIPKHGMIGSKLKQEVVTCNAQRLKLSPGRQGKLVTMSI